MKDFFKGPVFRALLALLALLVVSAVVWFLGPFVAVGEIKPLGSVAVRLGVILLLLAGLLSWALELPAAVAWTVIGASALCLLIWHGGPLLAFGPLHPLAPVWARVLAMGLVLVLLLVWGLYKLYRALQRDDQLLQRWLHREGAQPALAREEIRHLADRARQAVSQLRQMQRTMAGGTGSIWSGLRRVVEGKRYLYELPWYMLIGQPGAGKSSLVLNAGLRFPLPDQMGAASARMTLERATGTQNCDWWLTNEAVFLDTAGRYTEQAPQADEQAAAVHAAEWRGFLGVLRQVRPRAPINGALLVVDVAELLRADELQRTALAAQLRARLEELRTHLGIRFPVYLLLAKADVLRGFPAYFNGLTSEARRQVWGFTLPWMDDAQRRKAAKRKQSGRSTTANGGDAPDSLPDSGQSLALWVGREFAALIERIRAGVAMRLQEEFRVEDRQSLYVLPHELQGLMAPVQTLVAQVFADSRYDTTQVQPTLRGVYLCSAVQPGQEMVAQPQALSVRLREAVRSLGHTVGLGGSKPPQMSRRSFFLSDLLEKVVMAEAHLVQPNLRWETRMRLLRWIGHGVVLLAFVWLSGALALSLRNNQAYLQAISEKTETLTRQMKDWLREPNTARTEKVLDLAQDLPRVDGLNLASPDLSFQYGLYSAGPIAAAADQGYGQLLDRLVLPQVTAHMEQVLRQSVAADDAEQAYQTLRVYLLLHDAKQYMQSPDHARDVRQWIKQAWQGQAESLSQRLGNSAAMVGHLEWLFAGRRPVQSLSVANSALVQEVRSYLDKQSRSERLYVRVRTAAQAQAPQAFSLVRALGPQAGTLFSLASGGSLEQGVPGLFTYEGYHEVFAKQLAQTLTWAQQDDAWVMGQRMGGDTATTDPQKADHRALEAEVRRLFLAEYAGHWARFLDDVRLVRSDKSGTLAYDLSILRQLAAADSPLVRLARAAARETTLSRPLVMENKAEEKSIFEKAGDQLAQQQAKAGAALGVRPEARMERQEVDEKFSALREVVTGRGEGAAMAASGRAGLESMTSVLNEYYTVLVVADTALSAGSLPPAGAEAATKLRIEAGKMPAPLREVLMDLSASGSDKVQQGAASILRNQAQAQMDRLLGLLSLNVAEPCQRLLAGRYPFANSAQEVSAEDFNAFFAAGGAADEYFRKYLAPLVDTSARPWRYKSPGSVNLAAAGDGLGPGDAPPGPAAGPTLQGELLKLLAASGPNPDAFAQVGQIRDMFFRENEGKRMAWRGDYRVVSLDASVTEWVIDFDGQVQRYAHGAIQALPLAWPGPRGGTMAELVAQPRIRPETSTLAARGPWSWLRLVERAKLSPGTQPGRVLAEFSFDNRRAVLDIGSAGPSPFNSTLLRNFSCPGRSL
ncbi:type VI secretion system membrane subunit TssM [Aquincola tertiaricarbonis]|uniref:Type VI secretion system membrane subunit TssM n=1 Tax=Aquincola tertiaricarbonis TaxID=391953 RepID=A0ABY4S2W2_AQUTE|nr:type VI secretion system membrane subunit TssM [Aquincola tertiaricarbonis]URI06744.1 type VI secretion system membrane subunit TssM [Aquincola tertiaricarbonis]